MELSDTIKTEIKNAVGLLLGNQVARTITAERAEYVLNILATKTAQHTRMEVLFSLKTVQDVAEVYRVTPRRIRAIAKARRERGFPLGWQVPGTNQWLFLPDEVEQLEPGERGKSWAGPTKNI